MRKADERRERLHVIHMELGSYGMSEKKMDEMVDEMTYLIEKEEIRPLFCEYYQVVARAYMSAGNFKKAAKYVQIADDIWRQYGGENHENVQGIRELLDDLKMITRGVGEMRDR